MATFLRSSATTIFYISATLLARLVKLTGMIGQHTISFSLASCGTPLIGLYTSLWTVLTSLGVTTLYSWYTTANPLLLLLHIPTLGATLYLYLCAQPSHKFLKTLFGIAVLAFCTTLFLVHPIGFQAKAYTLLWLVPGIMLMTPSNNSFIQSYITTYIAHAIGSVIWLYTIGPVTAEAWLALIPLACLERLLFASGMTILRGLFTAVHTFVVTPKEASVAPSFTTQQ